MAAKVANVFKNAVLVRLGPVADLLDQTGFALRPLTLYALLQHVRQSAARAMLVLVALAPGIARLDTVVLFEGLHVATAGQVALFTILSPRIRPFFKTVSRGAATSIYLDAWPQE